MNVSNKNTGQNEIIHVSTTITYSTIKTIKTVVAFYYILHVLVGIIFYFIGRLLQVQ